MLGFKDRWKKVDITLYNHPSLLLKVMGIGAFCWCVVMIVAGLVPTRSWWGKLWFSMRIFQRRAVHLVILSYSRIALVSTWNILRTHTHMHSKQYTVLWYLYHIEEFRSQWNRKSCKALICIATLPFRPSKSNHPKRWNPSRWGGWGTSLPGKFVVNFSGSLPATQCGKGRDLAYRSWSIFFSTFLISSWMLLIENITCELISWFGRRLVELVLVAQNVS